MNDTMTRSASWPATCRSSYGSASLRSIPPVRSDIASAPEAGALVRVRPFGVLLEQGHVLPMFSADQQANVQAMGANKRNGSGSHPWRPPA